MFVPGNELGNHCHRLGGVKLKFKKNIFFLRMQTEFCIRMCIKLFSKFCTKFSITFCIKFCNEFCIKFVIKFLIMFCIKFCLIVFSRNTFYKTVFGYSSFYNFTD